MIQAFIIGLILGGIIGAGSGVTVMAMMFVSKGTDDIITELSQALQEWVDLAENVGFPDTYNTGMQDRSCKALNRARGME